MEHQVYKARKEREKPRQPGQYIEAPEGPNRKMRHLEGRSRGRWRRARGQKGAFGGKRRELREGGKR